MVITGIISFQNDSPQSGITMRRPVEFFFPSNIRFNAAAFRYKDPHYTDIVLRTHEKLTSLYSASGECLSTANSI